MAIINNATVYIVEFSPLRLIHNDAQAPIADIKENHFNITNILSVSSFSFQHILQAS